MSKQTKALPAANPPANALPEVISKPGTNGPRLTGLAEFGGSEQRIGTSLDPTTAGGRKILLASMNECDARLTECVNKPIAVVDFIAHDVELRNHTTGETKPAVRLVLVDANGLTYECVSETLLRSFQRLASLFGPPPWSPPKTLTPMTKKKGEFSVYWFDVEE
jgi:hypothetical protein